MRDYAVVIPAYKPTEQLIEYVNQLVRNDVAQVIIIDDGNGKEAEELFNQISLLDRCEILHHDVNRGKGAALRTAFSYFLEHYSDLKGVVTADADGQHLIYDVLSVGDRLSLMSDGFVLGSRVFERKSMPVRSYIGNTFTSRVFQLLFGEYIKDTQTGLRGITTAELEWVNQLRGDRFDYEMNMLINMVKKGCRIVRVDIEAVYAEVHISHYDTYKDSVKIARKMLKQFMKVDY